MMFYKILTLFWSSHQAKRPINRQECDQIGSGDFWATTTLNHKPSFQAYLMKQQAIFGAVKEPTSRGVFAEFGR